jgi:uncharacterized membrane protein
MADGASRRLAAHALTVASLLYPFLALAALRRFGSLAVIVALCGLLLVRAALGKGKGATGAITWTLLGVATVTAGIAAVDSQLAIRIYPMFMSLGMLAAFGGTLVHPPTMVERFARMTRPDLPDYVIAYTRRVTIAWCLFFAANAMISLATALVGDWTLWTFYNGFLSYVLIAALAGAEWFVRGHVKRKAGDL